MDISEYEALKENKKLLEDSLKNERVLRQELADAQQEALDAAKLNEKTVTIIKQVETREHTTFLRPDEDIYRALKSLFLGNGTHPVFRQMQSTSGSGFESQWAQIAHAFFGKTTSHRLVDDTVTRKGFDEVKEEVRKEYFKSLSRDTELKLEQLSTLSKEYTELENKHQAGVLITSSLKEDNEKLKSELDNVKESMYSTTSNVDNLIENLNNTINYTEGLFKNKKIVENVKSLLNKWDNQ